MSIYDLYMGLIVGQQTLNIKWFLSAPVMLLAPVVRKLFASPARRGWFRPRGVGYTHEGVGGRRAWALWAGPSEAP